MKTLLLLRHGKAVGSDPMHDHERALNARGRMQASEIGRLLVRLGLEPDVVLVSDAQRTRETAALADPSLSERLQLNARLYAAPAGQIMDVVREYAGPAARVLVVGHNPGIGDLARKLERSGEAQAMVGLQQGFPTGALAVLEFAEEEWGNIREATGVLSRFIVPEEATPGG